MSKIRSCAEAGPPRATRASCSAVLVLALAALWAWPPVLVARLDAPGGSLPAAPAAGSPAAETAAVGEPASSAAAGPSATATAAPGADPLGATSPRELVVRFLDACAREDYVAAAAYLDLHRMAEASRATQGPELARQLETVLHRSMRANTDLLSAAPDGDATDGLLAGVDRIATVRASPGIDVDVLAEREDVGDGVTGWRFSSGTLTLVPTLAEHQVQTWPRRHLPPALVKARFLELQPWQWIGLLVALAAAVLLAGAAEVLLHLLLTGVARRTAALRDDALLKAARRPVRYGLFLIVLRVLLRRLDLPDAASVPLDSVVAACLVLVVAWLFLCLVDVMADAAKSALVERGEADGVSVVPLGAKIGKALVLVFALLVLLGDAGVDVKRLWTSLGIGAIAIALAAQKTLEDVFGGMTLIASRPVRVGDLCRFGTQQGRVEEIGLRQTRLRTADKGLLSVPNAQFASAQVENLSRREGVRLVFRLALALDTPASALSGLITDLRGLVAGHPDLRGEPAHVRFAAITATSLDVEVQAWVPTESHERFLLVQEDVLLRALALVETAHLRLAHPAAPPRDPDKPA